MSTFDVSDETIWGDWALWILAFLAQSRAELASFIVRQHDSLISQLMCTRDVAQWSARRRS